jgi:cardiolipin synthase (CMP-forming)
VISAIRIAAIPAFVVLLGKEGTRAAGLILLFLVVATDWVDGYIARRSGQVSTLGKILDPVADRLAIAAALVTLVVLGAFPLWAALLVLVRDGLILAAGAILLFRMSVRLEVRWIGKAATFGLMCAIPAIAWGNFDLWLRPVALVAGWGSYAAGIALYYVAAAIYAVDIGEAIGARRGDRPAGTGT